MAQLRIKGVKSKYGAISLEQMFDREEKKKWYKKRAALLVPPDSF